MLLKTLKTKLFIVRIVRIKSHKDSVGTDLSVRSSSNFLHASMPSVVGMFVYKDDTSRVTSKTLGGMSPKSLLVEEMGGVLYIGRQCLY